VPNDTTWQAAILQSPRAARKMIRFVIAGKVAHLATGNTGMGAPGGGPQFTAAL